MTTMTDRRLNHEPDILIDWFDDFLGPNEFSFLSNFHEAPVEYAGVTFPTSEHAFAWSKCPGEPEWRSAIQHADSPGEAKALGRACPLRPDWEEVKFRVMQRIVWAKFTQHPDLGRLLLDTGTAYLQEGTFWDDRVWGVDLTAEPDNPFDRPGDNWLGHILMHTRYRLGVAL